MRVDPQERYEYWVRYLARARPAWGVLLLDYAISSRPSGKKHQSSSAPLRP